MARRCVRRHNSRRRCSMRAAAALYACWCDVRQREDRNRRRHASAARLRARICAPSRATRGNGRAGRRGRRARKARARARSSSPGRPPWPPPASARRARSSSGSALPRPRVVQSGRPLQELKKKAMKQKGELKVYSADSDVAQRERSRTKTRTKAPTVVLDSKYQLGDEAGRAAAGQGVQGAQPRHGRLPRDQGDPDPRRANAARLQAVQTEPRCCTRCSTRRSSTTSRRSAPTRTSTSLEYMAGAPPPASCASTAASPRRWWRCTCGRCSTASSGSTRTACATATSRAPTCSSPRMAT